MGFINKLGNFVEDAASFAVPAGLFALGTFAGGGNPLAGKALMGAGAAGLGGFSRNEEEERIRKAQEEARRSAAVANLMNAISPGTGARGAAPVMPKAGFMEKVARGGAQGYDFYKKAEMASQAAKEIKNRLAAQESALLAEKGKQAAYAGATIPVLTSENRGGGPTPETEKDMPMGQFSEIFGQKALERVTPVLAAQREHALDIKRQEAEIAKLAVPGGGGGKWGKMQPLEIAEAIGVGLAFDITMTDEKQIQATAMVHLANADLEDLSMSLLPVVTSHWHETKKLFKVQQSTYLEDAVKDAIEEARIQDDISGVSLFNQRIKASPYPFSIADLKQEVAIISRAAKKKNFSEEQSRLMGGLIGLDHNLERVQITISGMREEQFNFVRNKAYELLSDIGPKQLVPEEFVGLMAQLGYTAEMSARIFSGAALSEYDERIYRNIFIGNAAYGRDNMLSAVREFRKGNRDRMMGVLSMEKFGRGAFDIAGSVLPDGSIATGDFDIALPEGLMAPKFGLDALMELNLRTPGSSSGGGSFAPTGSSFEGGYLEPKSQGIIGQLGGLYG